VRCAAEPATIYCRPKQFTFFYFKFLRQTHGLYRVARWSVFHRPGRYFTSNLAEAGKMPVFFKSVPDAGIMKTYNMQ